MLRLFIIIFFCLTSAAFPSEDATIETLKVSPVQDEILVSVSLSKYFPSSVSEAIRNGIEAVLTYRIELYKKGAILFLFDKQVASVEIEKSVSYNMWDKVYLIKTRKNELKFNSEKDMLNDMIKIEILLNQ